MSELRDRRLVEPDVDAPFDHKHYGDWVEMELVASTETTRNGWVRRERTYSCPSCGYELSESEPIRMAS